MSSLTTLKRFCAGLCLALSFTVFADTTVTMYFTDEPDQTKPAGKVLIMETAHGLLFVPDLKGLSGGVHGFHVHEHPDCGNQGMNAGDHYDPKKTGKHLGPYDNNGHLGDLPALIVLSDGNSTMPVLAPRIKKISEINNRSLMIHAGGDTYSDIPVKNGGGGGRMICGVIQNK